MTIEPDTWAQVTTPPLPLLIIDPPTTTQAIPAGTELASTGFGSLALILVGCLLVLAGLILIRKPQ